MINSKKIFSDFTKKLESPTKTQEEINAGIEAMKLQEAKEHSMEIEKIIYGDL